MFNSVSRKLGKSTLPIFKAMQRLKAVASSLLFYAHYAMSTKLLFISF